MRTFEEKIQDFRIECKKNKLPLTPQKLAIYEYLANTLEHPTAETIFKEISKNFESLSFATVYKNLLKFKDIGMLREIEVAGKKSRFDARMDQHHHLIYNDGTIHDVDIDISQIPLPKNITPEDIDRISINYHIKST